MIYFIKCVDRVKIGFTEGNVMARMANLRTGAPDTLELLGVMPGDTGHEELLHTRFRHCHRNGEWFSLTPELQEFIDLHATSKSGKPQKLVQFMGDDDFEETVADMADRAGVSFSQYVQAAVEAQIAHDQEQHENAEHVVNDFVAAQMERVEGNAVEFVAIYKRYRQWCEATQRKCLTAVHFAECLKEICHAADLGITRDGDTAYIIDIRLTDEAEAG